jgi:hypothetical protein
MLRLIIFRKFDCASTRKVEHKTKSRTISHVKGLFHDYNRLRLYPYGILRNAEIVKYT